MHDKHGGGNTPRKRDPDNDRLYSLPRAWRNAKRAFGVGTSRGGGDIGDLMLQLEAFCHESISVRLMFGAALHAFLSLDAKGKARAFLDKCAADERERGLPGRQRTEAEVDAWAPVFRGPPKPKALPKPDADTHEQIPLREVWKFEDDFRAAMSKALGPGQEGSLGLLWDPGHYDDGLGCPFCDETFTTPEGDDDPEARRRHLVTAHGLPEAA